VDREGQLNRSLLSSTTSSEGSSPRSFAADSAAVGTWDCCARDGEEMVQTKDFIRISLLDGVQQVGAASATSGLHAHVLSTALNSKVATS
jgi:hypothetical protein